MRKKRKIIIIRIKRRLENDRVHVDFIREKASFVLTAIGILLSFLIFKTRHMRRKRNEP